VAKHLQKSGKYSDTITNYLNCDSIINIDLTIHQPTISSIKQTACKSYISPSGKVVKTAGQFNDTIPNYHGCDSIITIDLTLNQASTSSISVGACGHYISPSGKIFTMSGVYTDTIPDYQNCDSIITIDLNIYQSTSSSISPTACNSYISPSGKVLNSTGIYKDTISNYHNCDSFITIDLVVNFNSQSSITETACKSFVSPSGKTFSSSGMYSDTIPNYYSCDSIISLNLTIENIDNSVVKSGDTLRSVESGANYQWLDCNNSYSAISGETNEFFVPDSSGNFAVEIRKTECQDTSACYAVIINSIENPEYFDKLKIYPNPTSGKLFIEFNNSNEQIELKVLDVFGKQVYRNTYKNLQTIELDLETAKGIYFIEVINEKGEKGVFKVVKE
jgi:hypothetical protein